MTLCLSSGGATAWLLPVFFLLPILIAFQDRPWLTGVLGIATAVAYLGVWIVYSKRDDTVGLPNIVYVHFAFLFWFALATTALCLVLSAAHGPGEHPARNTARNWSRNRCAPTRSHSRELAETLHDGPLQNLLAARLDSGRARRALQRSRPGSRATGRDPNRDPVAVRADNPSSGGPGGAGAGGRGARLVHQYDDRDHFEIETELAEVGKPPVQDLLYRAARELLTNVVKHADATDVTVRLERDDQWITLSVIDNGNGFDPALVDERITEGHIGLASLVARAEAMGGTMDIVPADGGGTRATITTPATAD